MLIQLPDQPAGVTRLVESGSSVSTFSTSGGVVTVRVVPDERYRQALLSLREEITRRLFEERETLSPGDLARLVGNLADVQDLIDDLAVPGASCSINASDFAAVRVFASLDQSEWVLTCTVEEA